MDILLKKYKAKLLSGETSYGLFAKSSDPAFVETSGYAGFDFIVLDMEHGAVGYENLQNLIRASVLGDIVPIVRVQNFEETFIGKALDAGALGIQAPQVTSADDAKSVIKASKFYPMGERGVCRFVRAAKYSSLDRVSYFREANECLVVLQVEGQQAISGIDRILAVEGFDILFIGPYDLSQSLGLPGEVTHSEVIGQMQMIIDKAKKARKVVGTFADTPSQAKLWCGVGVQYIAYSVDVGIYYEACKNLLEALSGEKTKKDSEEYIN